MSSQNAKRTHFILSIWTQGGDERQPVWRGSIEAPTGGKQYFGSLAQLNALLEASGWADTPLNRLNH